MIVAEDKKIKKCPVSLQPDIENLLQDLSPDDFASASRQEKDDFIQDRQSVSYWKDAWRRLKKNVVAMVALGVIVFLFLICLCGPASDPDMVMTSLTKVLRTFIPIITHWRTPACERRDRFQNPVRCSGCR